MLTHRLSHDLTQTDVDVDVDPRSRAGVSTTPLTIGSIAIVTAENKFESDKQGALAVFLTS